MTAMTGDSFYHKRAGDFGDGRNPFLMEKPGETILPSMVETIR